MASMAPTSGGQYHWVSEFAPPEYQKLLSYFTGWMSAMSWQAGAASGPFLVGTMIQSLVYVNKESYEATNWQGTMMVGSVDIAVVFYQSLMTLGMGDYVHRVPWQRLRWKGHACVPERYAYRSRLRIPGCRLSLSLPTYTLRLRFYQIIVMFWVLAPRNPASVVFTQFTDSGGWSSMGMALMVGQISAIYACICSDAAAHMSEEIKVCSLSNNSPKSLRGS
jgi:amino acid transporter